MSAPPPFQSPPAPPIQNPAPGPTSQDSGSAAKPEQNGTAGSAPAPLSRPTNPVAQNISNASPPTPAPSNASTSVPPLPTPPTPTPTNPVAQNISNASPPTPTQSSSSTSQTTPIPIPMTPVAKKISSASPPKPTPTTPNSSTSVPSAPTPPVPVTSPPPASEPPKPSSTPPASTPPPQPASPPPAPTPDSTNSKPPDSRPPPKVPPTAAPTPLTSPSPAPATNAEEDPASPPLPLHLPPKPAPSHRHSKGKASSHSHVHSDSDVSSPQPAPSDSPESSNSLVSGAVAGACAVVAVVAFVAIVFCVLRRKKGKRVNGVGRQSNLPPGSLGVNPDMYYAPQPPVGPGPDNPYAGFRGPGYHPVLPDSGGSKLWFSYDELNSITNGFSPENLLGEGGFGCVYKGCLLDGRLVAVKQLKFGGGQGEKQFRAEVEIISRVHHRHLVSLVGYCVDQHHRLLVYDYLPNKTLEYHLHEKNMPVMDWSKRMKIAIGSARGLAYLHEDCHPRIIHRDIKSANILLDNTFEAQVSDFGLAKLSDDAHSHISTRVVGTFGYMAPEYAASGKLTDRSDVFSFGVVLLELITGRKPVDPSQPLGDESLVEWVRPRLVHALETGEIEEVVDPRLEKNYLKREMMVMIEAAAACVRHAAPKRPRMVQVLRALDTDYELSDLSNGMKFGHSQIYNSAQYSAEIRLFHGDGPDSEEFSSNYETSGEYESRLSPFSNESCNREATP